MNRFTGTSVLVRLTVVVLASSVVLCAGGLGTGVTYALVDSDAGHVPQLLGAAAGRRDRPPSSGGHSQCAS